VKKGGERRERERKNWPWVACESDIPEESEVILGAQNSWANCSIPPTPSLGLQRSGEEDSPSKRWKKKKQKIRRRQMGMKKPTCEKKLA